MDNILDEIEFDLSVVAEMTIKELAFQQLLFAHLSRPKAGSTRAAELIKAEAIAFLEEKIALANEVGLPDVAAQLEAILND